MANKIRDPKREAFWRDMLAQHRSGSLSIRAFCRHERLSEPSFYAWRRVIAERDAERSERPPATANGRKPRRHARRTPRPAFLPVLLGGNPPLQPADLVIELRDGRQLRLPQSLPAARVADLIHALESASLDLGNRETQP